MNRLNILSQHISTTAKPLKGKTVVITGASRGIGLAIGLRCARDGANIAILAKTTEPQPTLPGTFWLIKVPFIQQQKKLKIREVALFLYNVILEAKKVSKSVLKKLFKHLEELTF